MEKVKNTWNEKQSNDKVLTIIGITCSIGVLVLSTLHLLGILYAVNIIQPLLGVLMLIQTIQNWKKSKPVAILSLIAATFIFLAIIM